MLDFLLRWAFAVWDVLLDASSWFLLGLAAAAVLRVVFSENQVASWLRGDGLQGVLRGSLIGVPLPLCSCGVLPVAGLLRRGGASRGAIASFLVSTPEIGIDSFVLSWALLGSTMAVVRVVLAFLAAMLVGCLVQFFGVPAPAAATASAPCCSTGGEQDSESGCCSDKGPPGRFLSAYREIFVDMLRDFGWSFLVGILLAGLLAAVLPTQSLSGGAWGSVGMVTVMLIASIPLYVCASGSTPIAASLLRHGVSPGAALVFLLAGPATNIPTVTLMMKELGRRNTVLYVAGVICCSVVLGSIVDVAFVLHPVLAATDEAHEHGTHSFVHVVSACVLLVLFAQAFILPRFRRGDSEAAKPCCANPPRG